MPAVRDFTLPAAIPAPSTEMASLALAGAVALSCSIFSFRFDSSGLTFLLYRDAPSIDWILLGAGLGWYISRALHASAARP